MCTLGKAEQHVSSSWKINFIYVVCFYLLTTECVLSQFGFFFKEKMSLRESQEKIILVVPIFLTYIPISSCFSSFFKGG